MFTTLTYSLAMRHILPALFPGSNVSCSGRPSAIEYFTGGILIKQHVPTLKNMHYLRGIHSQQVLSEANIEMEFLYYYFLNNRISQAINIGPATGGSAEHVKP